MNCPYCEVETEMSPAGFAAHIKKCRSARQWQRDHFRTRGKWPSRKDKRIVNRRTGG